MAGSAFLLLAASGRLYGSAMLDYKMLGALACATSLKTYTYECVAGSVPKVCKASEQQQEYSTNLVRRVNA
jgi:hypothetical protein